MVNNGGLTMENGGLTMEDGEQWWFNYGKWC